MLETKPNCDSIIMRSLKRAIEEEIKKETEIAVEKAKQEIENKIPEIISRVSLEFMHHVNMREMENEIHIYIEKKRKHYE